MEVKVSHHGPQEWIELIEKHAESLRKAGVTRFEIMEDGCKVDLSPHIPTLLPHPVEPDPDLTNPLDDPATFGLRGDRLPGFSRHHINHTE